MAVVWANNAVSTLALSISPSSPTLTVAVGHGARFPSGLTATNYCIITVQNGATFEIMHVVGRTGDVLTVVRAQEGTSAASFAIGSSVECRVTAGGLGTLFSRLGDTLANLLGITKGSGQESVVRGVNFSTNARRWEAVLGDSALESGGNAGSHFALRRYSDADALLGTPMTVTRDTGDMTLTSRVFSLSATGAVTLNTPSTATLTATGALTLAGSTVGIAGNTALIGSLSVTAPIVDVTSSGTMTLSATGALTFVGATVGISGNTALNGSLLVTSAVFVDNALVVSAGGATVAGGVTVTTGGLVVSSGNIAVTSGDVLLDPTARVLARNTIAAGAFFSFAGGSVTTYRAFNCTIARSSAGVGTVTFTTPLNTIYYVVTGQANTTTGTPGDAVPLAVWNKTVNGFSFACKVVGNATYYDAPFIEFAIVTL